MSAAAGSAGIKPVHRGLTVFTVMCATFMYSLDWTIAAIALPHMQGSFSATQDQISWVMTSYIVASAIMMPTAGTLSRRFGRRTVFLGAVGCFTVASFLCAVATSLEAEVIFRILQGAGGAFLIPISQSIVLDSYPVEEHPKAMAIWSIGAMMGPILGPTVGGFLTDFESWRWIFYINLPVGAAAILGALAFVPETTRDPAHRLDWTGFLALALGVGALQMMLDRGERLDWFESTEVVIEAALAVLAMYFFVAHSLTARQPFLNPRLLRDRNFAFGLLFVFLYGLLTLAPMVLMPPFLQDLQGFPVIATGLSQSPRGIGLLIAAIYTGRVGHRIDPRFAVGAGMVCLAASTWMMSGWNLEVGLPQVVLTSFLQGVGAGLVIVPLGTLTFVTLGAEFRTEAASVFNLMRSIGSSIGISVALTLLTRMSTVARSGLTEAVTPYNERLAEPAFAGRFDLTNNETLAALSAEIDRQAAMIAYVDDFHFFTIAALAGLPFLMLLKFRRPGQA
jgi:DHA2 family multidrug resistance protein